MLIRGEKDSKQCVNQNFLTALSGIFLQNLVQIVQIIM